MYTKPLGEIIRHHGLCYHFYAHETQLYFTFSPSDNARENSILSIEACIADIQLWMTNNMLKLNGDKMELIIAVVTTMALPLSVLSPITSGASV